MTRPDQTTLAGWGHTMPSAAEVVTRRSSDVDALVADVKSVGERGAIARGLGRSYGDPAQVGGGLVVRLRDEAHAVRVDESTATATVPAGVSLDDLLRVIVPRGWFVPVTPGTRFVTIGGAIASDVHGKSHHREGSFGNHVRHLRVLLADGSIAELGPEPEQRPELFWATVGGMGLTGLILEATISLLPIETSGCIVDTTRVPDLETLLTLMEEGDRYYRYSVAWIDPMAKGGSLGRSVLSRGDHAKVDELPARRAVDPLAYDPGQRLVVPPVVPPAGVINRLSVKVFNELWYRKAPRRRVGQIVSIPAFFHTLDVVGEWNRVYGGHGFLQYQFLVPFGAEDAMRRALELMSESGAPSFLSVLKRFGAANPAPLSFPTPGWTLTIDVPTGTHRLSTLLHRLDELVLDAGGRHYLAKDAHTTPEAIRRGYPRLAEWQAVQRAVDPAGVWASDQSRRLRLLDDRTMDDDGGPGGQRAR